MNLVQRVSIAIFIVLFVLPRPTTAGDASLLRREFLLICGASLAAGCAPGAPQPATSFGTVSWEIVGPDSLAPVRSGKLSIPRKTSVGDLTVEILRSAKIPFVGTAEGIQSILGTPTGADAIEEINENTIRAYGWCYEVNGKQPSEMPDKYFMNGGESQLRWFYGYILFQNGQWATTCEKAS